MMAGCAIGCEIGIESDTYPDPVERHLLKAGWAKGDQSASCVRIYDGVDPNDTDTYDCRLWPSGRRAHCDVWTDGSIGCLEWTVRQEWR